MSKLTSQTSQQSRKVFNIDGQIITAGGVLMAKIITHDEIEKLYVLLVHYEEEKYSKRYDDFGGIARSSDKSIIETIFRKVDEESNCQINRTELFEKIDGIDELCFCDRKSKYVLYLALNIGEWYPDTSIFGTTQETTGWPRTVQWYEFDSIKNRLSIRLKINKKLMDYLTNLSSDLKKKQNHSFAITTGSGTKCEARLNPYDNRNDEKILNNDHVRNIQRSFVTIDNTNNKKTTLRTTYYNTNTLVNRNGKNNPPERIEQTISRLDQTLLTNNNNQPKKYSTYKEWLDDDDDDL